MAAPNSTHGSPKTFEVSCVTISSEIESILRKHRLCKTHSEKSHDEGSGGLDLDSHFDEPRRPIHSDFTIP